MPKSMIYADFNNADSGGCLRLTCIGTIQDLARLGLQLREGMPLILHDEELEVEGEAHFSEVEHIWVARIDWQSIRQTSA